MYFDCGGPEQSCVMCVVLGNHLSQPGSFYCGPGKCVTDFVEGICIVINSFRRSEVHSKPIVCELYVVKFWEGMVRNSFSCHAIPKRWACACFGVPFSPHTRSQIVYA